MSTLADKMKPARIQRGKGRRWYQGEYVDNGDGTATCVVGRKVCVGSRMMGRKVFLVPMECVQPLPDRGRVD